MSSWFLTFLLGFGAGVIVAGTWVRARQLPNEVKAYRRGARDARDGLAPRPPLDLTHPAVGKPERGAATWTGPAVVVGLVALVPVIGWAVLVAVVSLGVALFAAEQLREGS